MRTGDTIMALSSGAVPAGVAVVRLSGPLVPDVLVSMSGDLPEARRLVLRDIGQPKLDRGLVAYFPTPHSFTGEHCAELHLHGSPAGVKAVLAQLKTHGLRLADPGEFTRRAFENGKLDLVEVEGLGDMLSAETELQRKQALARLDGQFSARIERWRRDLLDLRSEIEARLDFSDEGDVAEELPERFQDVLSHLQDDLRQAHASLKSGRIIREGVRVALAGAPNVGKSSLINALARSDIAIVSDEAGTTRDVREVQLDIGGQLFVLLDLAGLREAESKAEIEGIRRAEAAIGKADIVLWITAPDVETARVPPATDGEIVHVTNKSDLAMVEDRTLAVSTVTGAGIDGLVDRLRALGEKLGGGELSLVSHERDRLGLEQAIASLDRAQADLEDWELAAEDLRSASSALERMVGRLDAERVLDHLFATFCIGK